MNSNQNQLKINDFSMKLHDKPIKINDKTELVLWKSIQNKGKSMNIKSMNELKIVEMRWKSKKINECQ